MRRTRHLFLFLFCMFGLLSSPWLVLAHPQIEELEANGEWLERESEHFRFHFLPDSAAERDIEPLLIEAEQSLGRILVRLEMDYEDQLDVYLVDRVFWQGGAAYGGQEVLFSYLDRNYANVPINYYLDHELTHILAYSLVAQANSSQEGDGKTNTLLSEGLATWVTGGHYGPEPIHLMAAALPLMGRYITLETLLTDFRQAQHEIAYIESASFVGWLVERYGLDTVKAFYGAADKPEAFFKMNYAALEEAWLHWLAVEYDSQEVAATALWRESQIRFFELMRDYQQTFDQLARELPTEPSGWSPLIREKYKQNVDLPLNIALETQLIAAREATSFQDRSSLLRSNRMLDEIEQVIRQKAVISEPMLERRLQIATLLADYNHALERIGGAGLLPMVDLDWQIARQLFYISQLGGVRQEIAKIDLEPEQTIVFVALYSRHLWIEKKTATYKLTFEQDGESWRLSHISPIPSQDLIARSKSKE